MQLLRKSIWVKTQALLGDLLESSEFSAKAKMKMEDLLLALHGAEVFRTIGQAFSGSESRDLRKSIRSKCRQYLEHFRRDFFESLKSTFDNDSWEVLPMPEGFGIHSIKELRRNPHVLLSFQTIDAAMGVVGAAAASGSRREEKKQEDEVKEAEEEEEEEEEECATRRRRHKLGATSRQPQVYQKFLAGENIFDMLMEAKRKESEREQDATSSVVTTITEFFFFFFFFFILL